MIRIPQVRVVDEEGAQLGVMPTPQALAMAQERGLDLVEVAPMASPPVVKFLDFGQYKYELTKREKEAKRKQRSVTFKEVRLKPKIGMGDFDTKVRRAIQFLEEGDRIKVAVQFRGRELTHPEIGRSLLARFSEQIKDHGVVERAPLLEGKSMHITVASIHKPKVVEHPTKHGHETEERRGGRGVRHRRSRRPAAAGTGGSGAGSRRQRLRRRGSDPRHAEAPAAARPRRQPRPPKPPRQPSRRRPKPGSRRHRQPDRETAAAKADPGRAGKTAARAATKTKPATRRHGPGRRPSPRHQPRLQQESEARVPKIKTHKAAAKRIGVTGSGKVIRVNSWRGHHLEIKSSRRTRRYAGKTVIGTEHAKQVRRLLPYLGK